MVDNIPLPLSDTHNGDDAFRVKGLCLCKSVSVVAVMVKRGNKGPNQLGFLFAFPAMLQQQVFKKSWTWLNDFAKPCKI